VNLDEQLNPVPLSSPDARLRATLETLAPKMAVCRFLASTAHVPLTKADEAKVGPILVAVYGMLLGDHDWVVAEEALESFLQFATHTKVPALVAQVCSEQFKQAVTQFMSKVPCDAPAGAAGSSDAVKEADFFRGLLSALTRNKAKLASTARNQLQKREGQPPPQPQQKRPQQDFQGFQSAKRSRVDLQAAEEHLSALEDMLQGDVGVRDANIRFLCFSGEGGDSPSFLFLIGGAEVPASGQVTTVAQDSSITRQGKM